ncbi:MAG: glycosyltransferase [Planctomycetes bacterium]|nr:glycosyltransferase [Planctomycetota bacterium]
MAVYSERVLNIPRGALGITMTFARPAAAGQPGEVVVNSLLPGLPAERVLKRGDRIGRIDGSPLLSNTDLLRQVQSKRPGDEVVMTVRRIRRDDEGAPVFDEALQPVYEELTVTVALCSAELLDQFQTGSQRGPNIVQQARQKLQEVIDDFRPEVVECQHIWTIPYVVSELGLPYVVTAHHSDQMGYRYDRRIQPYANQAAARARWIFAVSEFSQREVLSLYPGIQAKKVVLLENGYNQRIFYPQQVSRKDALRALRVNDIADLPIITFSGKISRTKGVDILLRANRLVQREQKALLLIAGTGRLQDEFSAEEQADFHLENVTFVGHQPQSVVAQLHNLATVSVIPSRSEGFGLAALEAMGCGTPVVATRCGGPEMFVVGKTVQVENAEDLAAALVELLAMGPRAARELRQAACEKARHFSWPEIVGRRLRYYRQALT